MVIVLGNRHGDLSSRSKKGCFSERYYTWENVCIQV